MDNKKYEYVIESVANGNHHILRERIMNGEQLSLPIYQDQHLQDVLQYAKEHNMKIEAIGNSYEIIK